MGKIVHTKTYNLNHAKGRFKILISEHHNGSYYGGVLRDEWDAGMDEGQSGAMHIRHQKFVGDSEDYIYNLCIEWVHSNLGKDYQIIFPDLPRDII